MTHEQIKLALNKLRPNAIWSLSGDDLSGLTWLDEGNERPTNEEILAKIEELEE